MSTEDDERLKNLAKYVIYVELGAFDGLDVGLTLDTPSLTRSECDEIARLIRTACVEITWPTGD
jgi:hypothetical protein